MKKNNITKYIGGLFVLALFTLSTTYAADASKTYKDLEGYWASNKERDGEFKAYHFLSDGTIEKKECESHNNSFSYDRLNKEAYAFVADDRLILDDDIYIIRSNDRLEKSDTKFIARSKGNDWPSCR